MVQAIAQPFRQIHLDFHTSEHIVKIGHQFDPEEFAQTLVDAHVNSINCFARCHHGYIYYDTQRFPERRHPHLMRNLLKDQIEACHAVGIRVPIYTTIQWDYFTAQRHPEWLALDENGRVQGPGPYEAGFRQNLLVNSPYFDFLLQHVAEMFDLLPVDGFWFDIVKPLDDSSRWTRKQMESEGLNPADPRQRELFGMQVINNFKREMTAYVRQFSSDCTIFYNEGHVSPSVVPSLDCYTQLEIESIPSGEWGYTHFPITARYARTLDRPFLGMTGKFHTEWGDFHSLKNLEALEYECFQMLSLGAQCSIGDQLHPNGVLDTATYVLIGKVYEQVKAKEPWCVDVEPVIEIGVMLSSQFGDEDHWPDSDLIPRSMAGAYQMLAGYGFQFNYVSPKSDLSAYKVVILPDDIRLTKQTVTQLANFVQQGGKIIASHRGGLVEDTRAFPEFFGIDYGGDAPFNPDFVHPEGFLAKGLPPSEHVMYLRGTQVEACADAQVIASATRPYFNRTYKHFMSHKHAPSNGEVVYPAVIEHKNVVYFTHPIFSQYQRNAPRWVWTMFRNTLHHLLGKPLVTHNGPSTLQVTVNRQRRTDSRAGRWIVHLLHYIPIRRSDTIDVIEDVIPLHNLELRLQVKQPISSIRLVPEDLAISFGYDDGEVLVPVDCLHGHQIIELTFERQ